MLDRPALTPRQKEDLVAFYFDLGVKPFQTAKTLQDQVSFDEVTKVYRRIQRRARAKRVAGRPPTLAVVRLEMRLPSLCHAALCEHAAVRNISVSELCRQILRVLAAEPSLVDAILDDRNKASP